MAAIRERLAGSDHLVLQFTFEGGLSGDPRFTLIPPFSLYADGKLLVPGTESSVSSQQPVVRPVDAIYPTDEELATIYELIVDIGLPDYVRESGAIPGGTVADAGSTVARYFDSAGVHRYSVHALFALRDGPAPVPVLKMKELLDLLQGLGEDAERRQPVVPDRIQLLLLDPPEGGGLNLQWPLEVAPGDFAEAAGLGPCHVLTGSEVQTAMEKLAEGTLRTTWEHEGVRWSLWGRHLLEGEAGCQP